MSRGSTWWAAPCGTALLGRTPKELDFVVEGDAIPVARRAAERLDGALVVHERFGTATIRTATDAFDLVSARTETYERPGALPDGAARRDDRAGPRAPRLHRQRDRPSASTGREVAWPGAREDLTTGVLRVLHDRSFIDDPTRMLRLVRYRTRLGFAPDPHTAALIDHALLATVSQDRINREIRLLLAESPHLLARVRPAVGRAGGSRRDQAPYPYRRARTWTCGGSCAASARRRSSCSSRRATKALAAGATR